VRNGTTVPVGIAVAVATDDSDPDGEADVEVPVDVPVGGIEVGPVGVGVEPAVQAGSPHSIRTTSTTRTDRPGRPASGPRRDGRRRIGAVRATRIPPTLDDWSSTTQPERRPRVVARHLPRLRVWTLVTLLAVALPLAGCSRQAPSEVPAVDTLVSQYDLRTGIWPTTGWWNSANALTAVLDYMLSTGDLRYLWVVENTYAQKINAAQGNFVNEFVDDTGWWALAWIKAYDLTADPKYLRTARHGVDFMWQAHDDTCGGGLWWTVNHTYKNAIASELFIQAAAQLGRRLGDAGSDYVSRALSVWEWFDSSGMINEDLLINDGLDPRTCTNNGAETWTYNQGVVLGGLVALSQATGDQQYLTRARELAEASTTAESLNPGGVLVEPCEATGCDINGPSFKGIYVRNLGELNRVLTDHPYSPYLLDQATSAYDNNRTSDSEYGIHWAGPIAAISAATQQSAVDLLVAAQPIEEQPTTSGSGSMSSTSS